MSGYSQLNDAVSTPNARRIVFLSTVLPRSYMYVDEIYSGSRQNRIIPAGVVLVTYDRAL